MDQTFVAPRPQHGPDPDPEVVSTQRVDDDAAPSITLTADDLAAIEGLQALHAQRNAQVTTIAQPAPATTADEIDLTPSGDALARCPMPASLIGGATACPVGAGAVRRPVERSRADLFVRRLLRIADTPVDRTDAATYKAFRRSMMISATRCTLTYVVFPFVLPMLSFASGVGSIIGVVIGTFALVCDTFVIRRFFAVDHRYRWQFTGIVASIMVLLSVLLVQDLAHIVQSLTS